jgi:hypothetical protein
MAAVLQLLNNATATGSKLYWPGGRGVFMASGTFSGSTVKLQFQAPDGTLVDVGSFTTLTAAGGGVFDLPPGLIIATVTGGPPSGMYATAARVNP